MTINYQDRSLEVTYLQIFLRDYFGLSVDLSLDYDSEDPYKNLTNNKIRVTGYYNLQTYTSLALWMAYNYPKEGYPQVWRYESGEWTHEDFMQIENESDKDFKLRINKIIYDNCSLFLFNSETIQIPERVLSYIFNEVVTPISSTEEILRVKQLVLGSPIGQDLALTYHEDFMKIVETIQQEFINTYTADGQVELPEQFKDFKVTGYVDPWTEVIIKGGMEQNDF